MPAAESLFKSYMSERIWLSLIYSFASGAKALKNVSAICHIQFQWKVTEHFRDRIKKKWSVRTKIALIVKIFRKKKFAGFILLFIFNLPTVKIWKQSDKFPMSFSFLQCPLQVNKLIWENSAKHVNQMANCYFRPKPPFLLQYLIFLRIFFLDESSCLDLCINLKIKISTKWSAWSFEGAR